MKLRKKKDKDRKSSTNAYSRKGHVRQKLYTNASDKKRKKEQTTNACGKERKTKPQMLVAKKRKIAALIRQANRCHQINERKTKPQKLVANEKGPT